ncbi:MAG: methyltransferase, partial [Ilumatobacter sp.]
LYESFVEHLRPGGWLVMTILSETGAADPGEFHAPPGELTLFFDRPGCFLVAHHEADGEESIVLRRT